MLESGAQVAAAGTNQAISKDVLELRARVFVVLAPRAATTAGEWDSTRGYASDSCDRALRSPAVAIKRRGRAVLKYIPHVLARVAVWLPDAARALGMERLAMMTD